MKRFSILFLIAGMLIVASCNLTDQKSKLPMIGNEKVLKNSANFTTIKWMDTTYKDLGKVTEGQQVEVSYRFKNTGTKPLIITNVSASCGCTIPETPKEPFAPGAEGVIRAIFNSKNHVGTNHKEIYVNANTTPETVQGLQFIIQVVQKQDSN